MSPQTIERKTAHSHHDKREMVMLLPAFVVETLQRFSVGPQTGQLILNFHRGTIGSIHIKHTGPPAELDD